MRSPSEGGEPAGCQYVRHRVGIFVFPDMQRLPTHFTKAAIVAPIPGNGGIELRSPPVAIRLRTHPMLGAGVPEATIDEYSHPKPGQHEIRLSGEVPAVKPKANPACMKSTPQRNLGPGVPRPLTGHEVPDLIRRRSRRATRPTHSEAL